jgi:NAD(P)-dependent dehydrogenase (short-subunit alcohol dehydrogenase family)
MDARPTRGGVVITGASSGIGEACALRLDRLGVPVFAGVLPGEAFEALRRCASDRVRVLELDVTSPASIAAAVAAVEADVGPAGLRGLVNNAGVAAPGPIELLPLAQVRELFDVNLFGAIAVTQAFLPLLRAGRGRIVMMGSAIADLPVPLAGAYAASKAALRALTTVLRAELRRSEIHVALVLPEVVATPIWEKHRRRLDELASALPQEVRMRYELGPAPAPARGGGLPGLPPDVVAAAVEHALLADKPRTRYPVGCGARIAEVARRALLSDDVLAWLVRQALRRRRPASNR